MRHTIQQWFVKPFLLISILIMLSISATAWNQCNNTISTSGKYTLNQSLTCNGYAANTDNYHFRINISNVEIDCAGYTLTSNLSDGFFDTYFVRVNVLPARDNITIRNCNLVQIGDTTFQAIMNYYDNHWSIINNNITSNSTSAGLMRISHTAGDSTPKVYNITGNIFHLSGGAINPGYIQTSNGVNCSSGIQIYKNYFSIDNSHFIFNNRDNCEFAPSNGTGGIGNYYLDSRYNCTDTNIDGICDSSYNIYYNSSGYYPFKDYYATASYPFNSSSCTENWQCNGYSSCNISDLSPCDAAIDLNTCGTNYSGNYSEFSGQPCNYCSASLSILNQTACVNSSRYTCSQDDNYGTCCNITGLVSDCPQNASIVCGTGSCIVLSSYQPSYGADDISKAGIDLSVTVILFIAGFGGLIAILLLMIGFYKYVRKKR